MVYESLDDVKIPDDIPEDTGPIRVKWLSRYTLHDGYKLWRVGASYAKNRKPTVYFIVAKKRMDAVKKLLNKMDYMKYISEVTSLTEEQAEEILTSPHKFFVC